jgi:hypothetical protein
VPTFQIVKRTGAILSFAANLLSGSTAHAAVDFKKEILPLLESHCLKCHRAPHEKNGRMVKPKGDIRLDAAWALLQGNGDVVPVKPGDVEHSGIATVVSLPRDDDKAMPPEGKGDPLTPAEILTLKTWIAEGADFGGWEGNAEGKPAGPIVARALAKEREHDLLYKRLAEGLEQPASDVLKKAQSTGAQVAPIAPASPLLRVDFLTGVSKCDDNSVAALAVIANRIAHLDLARTNITDDAFHSIVQMPRLTRLDLRKTKVTDAGIAQLAPLKNLISINLFGVEATDGALATLAGIKSLQEICLFETKVTDAGVDKLKSALPGAAIIFRVDFSTAGGKAKPEKKQ